MPAVYFQQYGGDLEAVRSGRFFTGRNPSTVALGKLPTSWQRSLLQDLGYSEIMIGSILEELPGMTYQPPRTAVTQAGEFLGGAAKTFLETVRPAFGQELEDRQRRIAEASGGTFPGRLGAMAMSLLTPPPRSAAELTPWDMFASPMFTPGAIGMIRAPSFQQLMAPATRLLSPTQRLNEALLKVVVPGEELIPAVSGGAPETFLAPALPMEAYRAAITATPRNVLGSIQRLAAGGAKSDDAIDVALISEMRRRVADEARLNTAMQTAIFSHAPRGGLRGVLGHVGIDARGMVKGTGAHAFDVFAEPGKYPRLPPRFEEFRRDAQQLIDEVEQWAQESGLPGIPTRGAAAKEGYFYFPRQAAEVRGVQVRRAARPDLSRSPETATEMLREGAVDRWDDVLGTVAARLRLRMQQARLLEMSDLLEPFSAGPKELVPEQIAAAKGAAAQARRAGQVFERRLGRQIGTAETTLKVARVKMGAGESAADELGKEINRLDDVIPRLRLPISPERAARIGEIEEALGFASGRVEAIKAEAEAIGFAPSLVARLLPRGAVSFGETLTARQVLNIRTALGGGGQFVGTDAQAVAEVKRLYPTAVLASGRVRPEYVLDDVMSGKYAEVNGVARFLADIEHAAKRRGSLQEARKAIASLEAMLAAEKKVSPYSKGIVRGRVTQAEAQHRRLLQREQRALHRLGVAGDQEAMVNARVGLLKGLREQTRAAQAGLDAEYYRARGVYTDALAKARAAQGAPPNLFGLVGDGNIAIGTWRSRFFPREQADLLRRRLGDLNVAPESMSGWFKAMEKGADSIRFLSAIGDFAAPFIQGLPALGENPAAWTRATLRHYQAFLNPRVQARYMRENLAIFKEMSTHGVPVGDIEMFLALQEGRGLSVLGPVTRLPGGREFRALMQNAGRQSFGRFQASYDTFLSIVRAELWKAAKPRWDGTLPELAQYVRNATGGLDSRALGLGPAQRAVESMFLAFSPRLLRSTIGYIGDALRPMSPQGRESLRSLLGLMSGTVGVYSLSGLALGKSWEEIQTGLNPLSGKRFLSHQIDGDWIGVGGQIRAIMQAVGQTLSTAGPGGTPAGDLLKGPLAENPILGIWQARGGVGLRMTSGLVEALSNGTHDIVPFDRVDSIPGYFKFMGKAALPFAVQGWLDGQRWLATGTGLAGARTSSETIGERRDRLAQEAGYEDYGSAPAAVKLSIANDPELREMLERNRDPVDQERLERELGLVDDTKAKRVPLTQLGDQYGAIRQWYIQERAHRQPERRPDDERKAALWDYYRLFDDSRLGSGEIDWDAYDDKYQELLKEWSPEQRWWVENNNLDTREHPPLIRAYVEYRRLLRTLDWRHLHRNQEWFQEMPEASQKLYEEAKRAQKKGDLAYDRWFEEQQYGSPTRVRAAVKKVDDFVDEAKDTLRGQNASLDLYLGLFEDSAPVQARTKALIAKTLPEPLKFRVLRSGGQRISDADREKLRGLGYKLFEELAEASVYTLAFRLGHSPETLRRWDWMGQAKAIVEAMR